MSWGGGVGNWELRPENNLLFPPFLSSFPQIIIAKKRGLYTRELQATAVHMESSRTSWPGLREATYTLIESHTLWRLQWDPVFPPVSPILQKVKRDAEEMLV